MEKNSMAKDMTERYGDYLRTRKLEERATKNIYFWVMSTLESVFWGLGRKVALDVDLYADEKRILFCFCHPSGKEYEYVYEPTYDCSGGRLPIMLQKFVEIFNNRDISFSISKEYLWPEFWASDVGKKDDKGKYRIGIHMDMLPSKNNHFTA